MELLVEAYATLSEIPTMRKQINRGYKIIYANKK